MLVLSVHSFRNLKIYSTMSSEWVMRAIERGSYFLEKLNISIDAVIRLENQGCGWTVWISVIAKRGWFYTQTLLKMSDTDKDKKKKKKPSNDPIDSKPRPTPGRIPSCSIEFAEGKRTQIWAVLLSFVFVEQWWKPSWWPFKAT